MSPAIYNLFGNWIPKNEISRSFSFFTIGGYVGSVITMPLSGYLCEYGNFFDLVEGWYMVFYVLGFLALLSVAIWWIFVFDSPSEHPTIAHDELIKISNGLDPSKGMRFKQSTVSYVLEKLENGTRNDKQISDKKPPKLGSKVPWLKLLTAKGMLQFSFYTCVTYTLVVHVR